MARYIVAKESSGYGDLMDELNYILEKLSDKELDEIIRVCKEEKDKRHKD